MGYETKKDIMELIRKIGAEKNLIRVDGCDLMKMFENARPIREYKADIGLEETERVVTVTLKWFTAEVKHAPKSVYFKVMTSSDLQITVLETLQKIGEAAGEDTKCVFAYNRQQDIPAGQCHLEMLVA